ncbi:hypothetical protein PC129_g2089 [Phytophthora cactorum]|uniref:Uncharacterized protein n=1 Tax=Phytophthora cactorum TaxID=29920 RepID=A0A329SQG4_9STRA|nr:hypothetical protein Pcac1_g14792 [Phytophthora cactorum]KAG3179506.1 hypothetical protein PC128_g15906 [Phytophthora cactorum]KAG3227374.1 hypothetical protein PC129_g2089 [Phytophthora cactorum]RAW38166.1 hypothetical protein PC110_g5600 [Phytophthora cactorum]
MAPPFREAHALRYGLEVVARDAESGAATCLVCLFCRHFGREERPGAKRKTASTVKYFRLPFRTDLYQQHLVRQHPTQWYKYFQSSDELKREFFPTDLTRPDPGKTKIETERDVVEAATAAKKLPIEKYCWFLIPKRIVDLVVPLATISGAKGWQPSSFRACEAMELSRAQAENIQEGVATFQEEREKYYQVAIFTRMELDVAVDSLATGMSPRQVALQLAALARRTTRAGGAAPVFPLLKEEEVTELARLIVSTSMQRTGQLIARAWAFGLALREVTAAPRTGYLDVRVVVYAGASTLAQVIQDVLDAVFPLWRTRVLGITQDGHAADKTNPPTPDQSTSPVLSTSSECHTSEVLALLETSIQTSIPNRLVHKTWGACRQVSLALSSFYDSLLSGDFLPALRTLTTYICQNPVLLQEMGPPPCDLATDKASLGVNVTLKPDAEWMTMELDTQWITDKRVRLGKYLQKQVPSSSSSGAATPVDDAWWIAFFVVHWVATRANEAFEKLRWPRISLARQAEVIKEMLTELMTASSIQKRQQEERQERWYHSRKSTFSILKSKVHEFLDDQGMFVSNVVARLDPASLDSVLESLAICLVNLAESLSDLIESLPESKAVDEATLDLPPVLPHELAKLSEQEFSTLLHRYGEQLRAFYCDKELETLETEYLALCRAATQDTDLKTALAQCNVESLFSKAWERTQGKFPLLQAFAGGLASAYVGRDVGSSTSLVDMCVGATSRDTGNDGLCLAAMKFGLETTLHARQFDSFSKLFETAVSTKANRA